VAFVVLSLVALVFLTGCITITVPPPIYNPTYAIGKDHKDLTNLCGTIDSAFWQLPTREKDFIAKTVFENMDNIDRVQYIGVPLQNGKPYKVDIYLWDKFEYYSFHFLRDWRGRWFLDSRGYYDVDSASALGLEEDDQ
jgi:hypothetical protein